MKKYFGNNEEINKLMEDYTLVDTHYYIKLTAQLEYNKDLLCDIRENIMKILVKTQSEEIIALCATILEQTRKGIGE